MSFNSTTRHTCGRAYFICCELWFSWSIAIYRFLSDFRLCLSISVCLPVKQESRFVIVRHRDFYSCLRDISEHRFLATWKLGHYDVLSLIYGPKFTCSVIPVHGKWKWLFLNIDITYSYMVGVIEAANWLCQQWPWSIFQGHSTHLQCVQLGILNGINTTGNLIWGSNSNIRFDLASKVKVKLNFAIHVGSYLSKVCILTVLADIEKPCMLNFTLVSVRFLIKFRVKWWWLK